MKDLLSSQQSASEKRRLFAMLISKIYPHCLMPCLQYISSFSQNQTMEGMNIYNPNENYHYSMPFYPQYYSYFNYWNQYHFNMQHSQHPPVQSSISHISNNCEPKSRPKSQYSSDFTSQQQQQTRKVPYLITRSKASKQSFYVEKTGRLPSKISGEQRQNRNVYSNILRNFFRKINDYSKIEGLIEKIITKKGLKLTKKEFTDYIKKIKINHSKYLRFKKLRKVFVNQHLSQHSMVFRILLQYFTKEELLLQALTSRKIGKWSVILHLKGAKELKEKLFY